MSVGFLVLVFTSIVDTEPRPLVTKAVLPSGVLVTPAPSNGPTAMSPGCLVPVFTSIVDTLSTPPTKAVLPSGVIATPWPRAMPVKWLVLVFTSIVDTVPLPPLVTKAVLPSGVIATWVGNEPTAMSLGFLALVFTSIVDTESPLGKSVAPKLALVTKAVLPSGVTATPLGFVPTGMSVAFLVLVFTSIVDTVALRGLATKAVLPSGVIATRSRPAR